MPKTPSQKNRRKKKRISYVQDENRDPIRKRWESGALQAGSGGLAPAGECDSRVNWEQRPAAVVMVPWGLCRGKQSVTQEHARAHVCVWGGRRGCWIWALRMGRVSRGGKRKNPALCLGESRRSCVGRGGRGSVAQPRCSAC